MHMILTCTQSMCYLLCKGGKRMTYNFRTSGTDKKWSVGNYRCIFNCTGGISYITSDEIVLNKGYTTSTEYGSLQIIKEE